MTVCRKLFLVSINGGARAFSCHVDVFFVTNGDMDIVVNDWDGPLTCVRLPTVNGDNSSYGGDVVGNGDNYQALSVTSDGTVFYVPFGVVCR